jgi:putative PIN family toxin of toxin-antitoxin system
VLDTNVWLDWLVFADPRIAPLKTAVSSAAATIFIDACCLNELARVLAYPLGKYTLDVGRRALALGECERIATRLSTRRPADAAALPRCRDPDDQKFLELARDAAADVLVTKDRALLELARRRRAPLPFGIVRPEELAAWWRLAEAAAPG